jgi:hypothetical protein
MSFYNKGDGDDTSDIHQYDQIQMDNLQDVGIETRNKLVKQLIHRFMFTILEKVQTLHCLPNVLYIRLICFS